MRRDGAFDAVEGAVREGGHRAGEELFGGLEAEPHGTPKTLPTGCENPRHPEHRGKMRVVSAQVRRRATRSELPFGRLVDRQRVELRPDEDSGTRKRAVKIGKHPGASDSRPHREPESPQGIGDERGSSVLLEAELGVGVDVPAKGDELWLEGNERLVQAGGQNGGVWVHGVAAAGAGMNPS